MSVNYQFGINAREVFAALRETKRLPAAINGSQVDVDDDETTVDFRYWTAAVEVPIDTDLITMAVYIP